MRCSGIYLGLIVGWICLNAVVLQAAEPEKAKPWTEPEQVFQQALKALEDRDFETYVSLLTPEEQQFHAGAILLLDALQGEPSLDKGDVSTYLLRQSIEELLLKQIGQRALMTLTQNAASHYSSPSDLRTEKTQTTHIPFKDKRAWLVQKRAELQSQLIGQLMQVQLGFQPSQSPGQTSSQGRAVSQHRVKIRSLGVATGAQFEAPDQLVVQVLQEIYQPMFTSQGEQVPTGLTEPLDQMREAYQKIDWLISVRGSRAVAVPLPNQIAPEGEEKAAERTQTQQEESFEEKLIVELVLTEQGWKLARFIPEVIWEGPGTTNSTSSSSYRTSGGVLPNFTETPVQRGGTGPSAGETYFLPPGSPSPRTFAE